MEAIGTEGKVLACSTDETQDRDWVRKRQGRGKGGTPWQGKEKILFSSAKQVSQKPGSGRGRWIVTIKCVTCSSADTQNV
ncbi:hypothetical protein E2C01_085570 [Portunus trituberculatus]|uniref:Uncharacterized protein n=1 Tax=Portunus trituberculatus TaxID=210409 RepID=A0A5B7J988_PORTR|nr:hypothetical protein [Portunus trituberculatus]